MGRLSYEARRARLRELNHLGASTCGPVGECWYTGQAVSYDDHVWQEILHTKNEPELHNGKWFIEEGKKQAYEETQPIVKAMKWLLALIVIGYIVSLVNKFIGLG